MRTTMRLLLPLFMLLLFTGAASAQMMRMTPEERADRLKDSLKLSAAQTEKVKAIYEDSQNAMQDIFQSNSGDREAMRTAMQEQMKKTDARIDSLLTKDQKVKYEEMIKNRPQWGRRQGGQ